MPKKLQNNWLYIKTFKMNSIFWRTFLLICAVIFVPFIVLSILFYSNSLQNLSEEVSVENSSSLESAVNIVDSTLMECDMMSSSIAINESAQMYTINGKNTDSFRTLTKFATTLPIVYKYIDSIYIYSESAETVILNENIRPLSDFPDTGWIEAYQGVDTPTGSMIARVKNNIYPPLITIIKPIYVADIKKGAVIMNLNAHSLYTSLLYDQYKDGQQFFLIDPKNNIILSNDVSTFNTTPETLGFSVDALNQASVDQSFEIQHNEYILFSADSQFKNYTYVQAYPFALYKHQLSLFRSRIIVIMGCLLIIVFLLAYIASARSYVPLREIISYLNHPNTALNSIGTKDENELAYIISSIQMHIEDKQKLEKIMEERVKMLRKAQYDMLQMQINPHFLYNTLETINWMAYNPSDPKNAVSKALVSLASFFRNTTSAGYLISIEDEIRNTKEYINILALRYGDLFDTEWEIEDSVLSYTIIKICLQPIIENAVYHGLKPKMDKGLIKISGKKQQNSICLTVSDNGIGMNSEQLDSLNALLSDNAYDNTKAHIGLANVNSRIKIIFGANYGITVDSREGAGTDVHITIPCEQQTT